MIVAVALLISAVFLILVAILGWTVYKLAEVRRDKASTDDLNRVIDHLNSLSHGVHRSHLRAEKRLDKAEGDVRTANATDVGIQARLDRLAERVEKSVGSADEALSTSAAVKDSLTGLSEESKLTSDRVGSNLAKLSKLETDLTMSNTDIGQIRTDLIEVRALAGASPDSETYATWSAMEERDVRAKSITLDGAGESGFVDTRDVKAVQYGLKKFSGGPVSGYIRAADGGGMQYVPEGGGPDGVGGQAAATLGSSGIRWGTNELKVAGDGSLQYCRGSSCARVSVADEPSPGLLPPAPITPLQQQQPLPLPPA